MAKKTRQLLLRIETSYFVAGAVWEKHDSVWTCVRAAPIIQWMVGKPAREVGRSLKRSKWVYQWIR